MDQVVSIHRAGNPAGAPPARLMSHATSAAVRHALRASATSRVLEARLRHAAANACEDARAAGLRIEQMLIALKEDWAAHPAVRRLPAGDARSDITSRFITLCIHEFFAANVAERDIAVGV